MGSTLTYAAASLSAALVAVAERFGVAPMPAVAGTAVPFAGKAARMGAAQHSAARIAEHAVTTLPNAVARKADDRARPRGRRL